MDSVTIIGMTSIICAAFATSIGCMMPALAEGKAVATALTSLAQQPDASATITRTLFVGLGNDRIHGNLLFRRVDDSDLCESVLESLHRADGG